MTWYESERERFAEHIATEGWSIDYAIPASVMQEICSELINCERILELGAGYSSACLRTVTDEVYTYDHNLEWAALVDDYLYRPGLRNVTVYDIQDWRSWVSWAQNFRMYDGILVDHGPDMTDRVRDMRLVRQCLKPGGVIILDDYKGGYKKQVTPHLHGLHVETRRHGSRHFGVAR